MQRKALTQEPTRVNTLDVSLVNNKIWRTIIHCMQCNTVQRPNEEKFTFVAVAGSYISLHAFLPRFIISFFGFTYRENELPRTLDKSESQNVNIKRPT